MKGMDWLSERMVFGVLFILGFLVLGGCGMLVHLSNEQRQFGRDCLLVIGPVLGLIANAIWKTDRADRHAAEAITNLSEAVNTAMTLPPAPEKGQ